MSIVNGDDNVDDNVGDNVDNVGYAGDAIDLDYDPASPSYNPTSPTYPTFDPVDPSPPPPAQLGNAGDDDDSDVDMGNVDLAFVESIQVIHNEFTAPIITFSYCLQFDANVITGLSGLSQSVQLMHAISDALVVHGFWSPIEFNWMYLFRFPTYDERQFWIDVFNADRDTWVDQNGCTEWYTITTDDANTLIEEASSTDLFSRCTETFIID